MSIWLSSVNLNVLQPGMGQGIENCVLKVRVFCSGFDQLIAKSERARNDLKLSNCQGVQPHLEIPQFHLVGKPAGEGTLVSNEGCFIGEK